MLNCHEITDIQRFRGSYQFLDEFSFRRENWRVGVVGSGWVDELFMMKLFKYEDFHPSHDCHIKCQWSVRFCSQPLSSLTQLIGEARQRCRYSEVWSILEPVRYCQESNQNLRNSGLDSWVPMDGVRLSGTQCHVRLSVTQGGSQTVRQSGVESDKSSVCIKVFTACSKLCSVDRLL